MIQGLGWSEIMSLIKILTHGHLVWLGGDDKDEEDGEEVNSEQWEHLHTKNVKM